MTSRHAPAVARVAPYVIELVPADRGWILEKIAGAIAVGAAGQPDRFHVTLTSDPSGEAELTFFLPESAWRDDVHDTLRVTYLAHKEDHPGAAALFEEVARKSDCCVTSSAKYAEVLRRDGAREVHAIPLGVDTAMFTPRVRVGIVGRTYPNTGRKGESLLAHVMDLPFVEFVFTGEGWPLPAEHYGERELADFYRSLDYLLVPSLIEGGPVPMLEALASGCPVIAPSDVGMVRDFPHIPFARGDGADLRRVMQAELDRVLALRAAALPCDWSHFAERHLELFADLIDRRRLGQRGAGKMSVARMNAACRALLVTHGSEDAAKGGPTTRVGNIVAHLRANGLPVDWATNRARFAEGRHDVIHVFNSWPPDSALATLAAARRSGAKVIFSPIALDLADWPLFHPFMERLFASAPSEQELRDALRAIRTATPARLYAPTGRDIPIEGLPGLFEKLRLCCDLADHVVFLSEYERRYLAAIGARVDHGVLIKNGVDMADMAAPDAAAFRSRHGLDRYLLCVGRLEYRKNQALAALAARDLDVPLVLIGAAGDGGYVGHVRRLGGRSMRIMDRIEDRALLASAYAGASAFVFPSWTEGAPLAAMEAGAMGTPLVLGEMSSERELFGDDACYVHPADVESLRATLARMLAEPEPRERRAQRAARFGHDFSVARHADETWSLYERLHAQHHVAVGTAGVAPLRRPVVADVSALLHFVRVGDPLTGVPLAELNILREVTRREPALRCIAFNDVKDRFIPIELAELEAFDAERFNATRWFAPDTHGQSDRRAVLEFADRTTPELPAGIEPPNPSAPRLRTRAVVAGKRMMQRAPRVLRDPVIALVRRFRPDFDPFQMPPRYAAAIGTGDLGPGVRHTPVPLQDDRPGFTRFTHPLGSLVVHQVARREPIVPVGARLLTLGQSWLSNEALLNELLRLTQVRALSLEPYVYDMTYHTGAHRSGWADNDQRFGRLLRLLAYSRRVYTESREVENELRKLAASRALTYATARTQLRGRDLADVPASRSGLSYDADTFVLVVSSFNRRKNHDFLVNVWRDLHETWIAPALLPYRLVLVGPVQEEMKYGDPAFVAELGRFAIDVLTNVPDPALAWLMKHCAFTAYPSLQEGWGLPAQESLMCGKVCLVSSTLPVSREIDNCGLVRIAPDDFFGWREALRTWFENVPMRRAFEIQARAYVPPSWGEIAAPIVQS
jgi:glycosyltransferase involved in cell wall biosynthesis